MQFVHPLVELNIGRTLNATRRELNALSDGQLQDIGLARGQIAEVAADLVAAMKAPLYKAPLIKARAWRAMSEAPLLRAFVTG